MIFCNDDDLNLSDDARLDDERTDLNVANEDASSASDNFESTDYSSAETFAVASDLPSQFAMDSNKSNVVGCVPLRDAYATENFQKSSLDVGDAESSASQGASFSQNAQTTETSDASKMRVKVGAPQNDQVSNPSFGGLGWCKLCSCQKFIDKWASDDICYNCGHHKKHHF